MRECLFWRGPTLLLAASICDLEPHIFPTATPQPPSRTPVATGFTRELIETTFGVWWWYMLPSGNLNLPILPAYVTWWTCGFREVAHTMGAPYPRMPMFEGNVFTWTVLNTMFIWSKPRVKYNSIKFSRTPCMAVPCMASLQCRQVPTLHWRTWCPISHPYFRINGCSPGNSLQVVTLSTSARVAWWSRLLPCMDPTSLRGFLLCNCIQCFMFEKKKINLNA